MDMNHKIDSLSSEILIVDCNDLQKLASIHTAFQELEKEFKGKKNQLDSAQKCRSLIEKILLGEVNPEETLKTISNELCNLQKAGGEISFEENEFNDDKIVQEFLDKQISQLERVETLALSLEKNFEKELLAELTRIIHTTKGEAGVLGYNNIEQESHRLENYLGNNKKFSADIILLFKDWLWEEIQLLKKDGDSSKAKQLKKQLDLQLKNPVKKKVRSPKLQPPEEKEPESMPEVQDPSLIHDFVTESMEHLETAETALLNLESENADPENLNRLFRCFHTIKGISGFLNLNVIMNLTHECENYMDSIRKGEIPFTRESADLLLKIIDKVKQMVLHLKRNPQEGYHPDEKEVNKLVSLLRQKQNFSNELTPIKEEVSKDSVKESSHSSLIEKDSIRIDTEKLDHLINLVGELVIAESMVGQSITDKGNHVFLKSFTEMKKISHELQELSMSLRMIPLKGTFMKMSRVVRDVARKKGKQVELKIQGEDTELDKTIVDKIGDPLIHMVRNAVDHGIEDSPEFRIQKGKPEKGIIELKSYHKGGNIYIEIQDDGKGLDNEAILKKGVEKGLIKPDESLSEQEIINLIFQPGFSTAKTVTEVSGRGVGMDVVKKNIESLRGQVEIQSQKDKGTTFIIKLPLTLAIIDGMVASVGKETYIMPTLSIHTSLRPQKAQISTVLQKGEMLKLKEELIPLFRLANIFNIKNAINDPEEAIVIVIEEEGCKAGIMVDQLLGQQEVVIKSLGETLSGTQGIAGGAIMGDGNVGLIIDMNGIIKMAKEFLDH